MLFKEDKAARAEHQAVRKIFRVSFCEPDWQGGSGKK